jgi:uncharacterized protein (TIGR02147 family)
VKLFLSPMIRDTEVTKSEPDLEPSPPAQLSPQVGTLKASHLAGSPISPFNYTDYREFLRDFYENKKESNPRYSMSAFIRKAGLKENSRGYLRLIINGERNLTHQTLRRFIAAIGLTGAASQYFEALVYFNQSRTHDDQSFYLNKLVHIRSQSKDANDQKEVMQGQLRWLTRWYYVIVREMVNLPAFKEDLEWIQAQLRNKVHKKEIQEAIDDLLAIGLLIRDENGKLKQRDFLIKFGGGKYNAIVRSFHLEMMDRARETILDDPYELRNPSCVFFACRMEDMPNILADINKFRDELNNKYGQFDPDAETVAQVNIQLFQHLDPKKIESVPPQTNGGEDGKRGTQK